MESNTTFISWETEFASGVPSDLLKVTREGLQASISELRKGLVLKVAESYVKVITKKRNKKTITIL